MRAMQGLAALLLPTVAAAAAVYLMVGPGAGVSNRPLAVVGVSLIGLGLVRRARRVAQDHR